MSAWAVTMGAGATMGSCMRHLPFHAGGERGPESITWTPAMAKYNSRVCMRLNRERARMELDFDQYKAQQFCDNPACQYYSKTGEDNIRTHSRQHQQVYC